LLAIGTAVYAANEQVESLDKSVRISAGTQENYARSTQALQGIADKYKKSIFSLAEGFTELTRETRGTVNEGARTQQIFDDLTSVSGKLGYQVGDTTSHLSSFVDKMKQGTVDSTHLTDELDKRLYEAFIKVADGMGITAAELNAVLKESDDAVNTVLPALTKELSNALGDIPQQDAKDLGDKIEYAKSKLTVLLDSLFQTSGGKTTLSQAAEDAGDFLSVMNKIVRNQGIMAAGGAAITMGAAGAVNALTPYGIPDIQADPFGYRGQAEAEGQRAALKGANMYQPAASKYKLPSEITKADFDVASKAYSDRIEAEEKANKKLMAEQKRLANERKRNLDEISRQEIQESNQRIRDGIQAAEDAANMKYSTHHGTLGAMGALDSTGSKAIYDLDKGYTGGTALTNPVGEGKAPNYDHITAQINSMSDAWWKEKLAKDASNQSSAEMSLRLENLNKELQQIAVNGSIDFFSGFAEGIGEISVNTGGIEKVGDRLGMAFGEMISQTGKAILTYGVTMLGLEKALEASFSNGYVALAVGAAAMIAGGALKAQAQKNQSSAMSRMWTGGIADGAMGIDMVPTMLTAGEMVLTGHDQRNLYGMITGSKAGSIDTNNYGSSRGGDRSTKLQIELESYISGSNIALANKKGQRESNYFE
jgi:hypothetical protein